MEFIAQEPVILLFGQQSFDFGIIYCFRVFSIDRYFCERVFQSEKVLWKKRPNVLIRETADFYTLWTELCI